MTTTSENGLTILMKKGIEGIISKIHKHKSIKFTNSVEKQIVENSNQKIHENIMDCHFLHGHCVYLPDL